MADIKFYIEQIQRAIYGEEVRSSIANALTVVNEDNNGQQALRDEVIHARDDMYDYVNDFNEKMNIADITKQQLVDATHSAEGSREQLNQSIKESSETEITLNEIVRIAEKSRNELDKSNLIAGNTKTQLDNIVKKAAYLDDNLADKIQEGNKLKTDLPVLISNEVKKITDAGTEEVRKVTETGDTVSQLIDGFDYKVTEVMSTIIEQGNTSIKAVADKGAEQTGNVTAEGEKQVQAVQAKGQEVINSIPQDFQTQMATKLDKQQGAENAGKALVIGDDGNVVPGEVQGGNGLVGEVLLADYTHQGNPEFHFSDFDFATGIGTTTEPHGLTTATSVLICPNDFKVTNFAKDIVTIPIEWTMENGQLQLLPVDDTHLKLIIKHTQKTIPANLEDISNKNVDITKFHFEKPISYVIKNIDSKIKTKYIKVCQIGYINYVGLYRYRRIVTIKKDGSAYVPNYINSLGLSFGGNSPAKNGVLQFSTLYADVRMDLVHYKEDIVVGARRRGQQNLVFDKVRLHNNYEEYMSTGVNGIDRIKLYETYSDDYANASNGTRIQIYALEGEYK